MKLYNVKVYFHAHYYLGSIDMGNQGEKPELIADYKTRAVSEKKAISNARFRFEREGGYKNFPHEQFEFVATVIYSEVQK